MTGQLAAHLVDTSFALLTSVLIYGCWRVDHPRTSRRRRGSGRGLIWPKIARWHRRRIARVRRDANRRRAQVLPLPQKGTQAHGTILR